MTFSQAQKDIVNKWIGEAIAPWVKKVEQQQQQIKVLRATLGDSRADNKQLRSQIVDTNIEHDNLESYGCRMNVRFEGLEHTAGETPDQLFSQIKSALQSVDIQLKKEDVVRFHRSGPPVRSDGKMVAQTIVKFARWEQRRQVHFANKRAREAGRPFRVHGDLTRRRHSLLTKAREKLAAQFPVEGTQRRDPAPFAYADVNSNLRIRRGDVVASFNTSTELDEAIAKFD